MGRGGRGQDDVGMHELVGQFVEADDRAAETLREAECAVGVAVGHEDRAGALLGERPRSQLAGLAGAEDDDVTRLEPIPVSERTRLPVVSAAANRRLDSGPVAFARIAFSCARRTWPWISASPRIIDSRPAVTR